ncbi:MAG: endolytic transglycosylase MltG [Candidatus Zambryskibacteria bacterium]|nr:endolytic transglycosylase MltG [Candidatus Zambryskibacteria bacterium]
MQFLTLAKSNEGYLFPDTYFISKTAKSMDVINMMKENFEVKINSVSGIATSTHKLKDIIIMASILEGEALPKDRNIVAGILWKRLEMGMPLQVDSTFAYINGKNTYELTLDDLKIDSPYNTYKYRGLPPGPISNPGLEAIISAINPIKTKYLYFLTEKDGTIHYAKTFEEHKRNKELYLK